MSDKTELEQKAQALLSEAHRLIREAGELAKQGQFPLYFGEVGNFIPKGLVSLDGWRERALEELKRNGRSNGTYKVKDLTFALGYRYMENPRTPFEELDESEVQELVEDWARDMRADSGIPREFLEYCDEGDADCWWFPSRC